MTTESTQRLAGSNVTSLSHGVHRDVGQWLHARVLDAGHEATFHIEVDERYARFRRVLGGTSSTIESRLGAPLSAHDIAQLVARWAASVSMTARVHNEPGSAVRVTLTHPTD